MRAALTSELVPAGLALCLCVLHRFYRAAAMQAWYSHERSVHPSARPSVKRVNYDKTKAPSEKKSGSQLRTFQ